MATPVARMATKRRRAETDDTAPRSKSRGAAPGRRQSVSILRRAKKAARTRHANAMRTQSTAPVGASVRATSDAVPPMSRYAATTIT